MIALIAALVAISCHSLARIGSVNSKTFRMVNSSSEIDSVELPKNALAQKLISNGLSVSNSLEADVLVAVNHNPGAHREFLKKGGSKQNAFLIRLEPRSVYPVQYRKSVESKYKIVITPGSVSDFKASSFFVGWPYTLNQNPAQPSECEPELDVKLAEIWQGSNFDFTEWEKRPTTISLIAANKVSPTKFSNYPIRRKLALKLSPQLLEVYGPLWNDRIQKKLRHRAAIIFANLRQGFFPNPFRVYGKLLRVYPSFVGTVKDKHGQICKSKFSLVIENSNTYVSEKLLDALIGGSIPIYIGPNLKDVGLPPEIAIQSKGDPIEINRIISQIDSQKAQEILLAISKFLRSSLFLELWNEDYVYEKMSREIIAKVKENLL